MSISLPTAPPRIAAELASMDRRWKSTSRRKSRDLLRLALLRELHGRLHALKSSCLARGDLPGVEASDRLEKRAVALAFQGREDTLPSSLVRWAKIKEETQALGIVAESALISTLPPKLIAVLGRDRLERAARGGRADRNWELLLTAEANRLGFEFWTLEAETPVEDAEKFQSHLARALWPKGIILFTRTVGIRSDSHRWQGQWTIALERATRLPQKIAECGDWKRIFP